MKKIYILIVVIAISFGANAQKQIGGSTSFKPLNINSDKIIDTLRPTPFITVGCDSFELYGAIDGSSVYQGYMTGTNGWVILKKLKNFI